VLQVIRDQLPGDQVALSITVPKSVCQEGLTETVDIMRRWVNWHKAHCAAATAAKMIGCSHTITAGNEQ
jgi:hypothetical protein